jgi:hypothetical protein
MAGKQTAVFGIYTSGEHAERAVDTIIAAGFVFPRHPAALGMDCAEPSALTPESFVRKSIHFSTMGRVRKRLCARWDQRKASDHF